MEERIVFREMLSEIKAQADRNGNKLSVEEIKTFFSNAHLTEEQLLLVYAYLSEQKVEVEGYQPAKSAAEKSEEAVLREDGDYDPDPEHSYMYQEELQTIQAVTEAEELELVKAAAAGDSIAKSKLVELHLQTVYDLAKTYPVSELSVGDLVQEGNIALLLAVEQLQSSASLEEYRMQLYKQISEAMEEAVLEYRDAQEMSAEIAQRANHLQEAVKNLERDLEHKVSVEELSAYLEMPEDEIRDILRMTGDEIEEKLK